MNLVTSKYLDPLHKTNNPAMSDSHVQSVVSSQSEDVWRCVLIYKLTEEENGGNHHVYIDLIDQNGARLAANPDLWIRYGWDGMKLDETPPFSPCEKQVGEPVANVEIASIGQVTWVEVVGYGLLSDRVVGMSSAPTGHGSWYVVFPLGFLLGRR